MVSWTQTVNQSNSGVVTLTIFSIKDMTFKRRHRWIILLVRLPLMASLVSKLL